MHLQGWGVAQMRAATVAGCRGSGSPMPPGSCHFRVQAECCPERPTLLCD